MKRRDNLRLTAVLLALVLGAFMATQTGCPGPEKKIFSFIAKKFSNEPHLTVFIKDTGAKKDMSIDTYIAGVVAGEMEKGWPVEAYAAQAIVARTFTMDFLARGGTRKLHGTDISTNEKEAQAYNAAAITPLIRKAVAMTKGKVMTYKGRYVYGWFSASCGGRTSLAKEGLAFKGAEPPYMTSVSCPEGKVVPKSVEFWTATFTPAEIGNAISAMGKNVGTVQNIKIAKKDKYNDRALTISVIGSNGRAEIPGADLRTALGPDKMRSIWLLSVSKTPQGFQMKGRGFGHGVGLCQWGSVALAKTGKSPVQIVKFYYPKVKIMDIW